MLRQLHLSKELEVLRNFVVEILVVQRRGGEDKKKKARNYSPENDCSTVVAGIGFTTA